MCRRISARSWARLERWSLNAVSRLTNPRFVSGYGFSHIARATRINSPSDAGLLKLGPKSFIGKLRRSKLRLYRSFLSVALRGPYHFTRVRPSALWTAIAAE